MMDELEENLGKVMTVKQVANYLNINEKTVRRRFQDFGGIKIGRHYRFFERSIIDAIQKQTEKQIYSTSQEERSATGKGISKIEPSKKMGSRDEKADRRRMERHDDRHGLLD